MVIIIGRLPEYLPNYVYIKLTSTFCQPSEKKLKLLDYTYSWYCYITNKTNHVHINYSKSLMNNILNSVLVWLVISYIAVKYQLSKSLNDNSDKTSSTYFKEINSGTLLFVNLTFLPF